MAAWGAGAPAPGPLPAATRLANSTPPHPAQLPRVITRHAHNRTDTCARTSEKKYFVRVYIVSGVIACVRVREGDGACAWLMDRVMVDNVSGCGLGWWRGVRDGSEGVIAPLRVVEKCLWLLLLVYKDFVWRKIRPLVKNSWIRPWRGWVVW